MRQPADGILRHLAKPAVASRFLQTSPEFQFGSPLLSAVGTDKTSFSRRRSAYRCWRGLRAGTGQVGAAPWRCARPTRSNILRRCPGDRCTAGTAPWTSVQEKKHARGETRRVRRKRQSRAKQVMSRHPDERSVYHNHNGQSGQQRYFNILFEITTAY